LAAPLFSLLEAQRTVLRNFGRFFFFFPIGLVDFSQSGRRPFSLLFSAFLVAGAISSWKADDTVPFFCTTGYASLRRTPSAAGGLREIPLFLSRFRNLPLFLRFAGFFFCLLTLILCVFPPFLSSGEMCRAFFYGGLFFCFVESVDLLTIVCCWKKPPTPFFSFSPD